MSAAPGASAYCSAPGPLPVGSHGPHGPGIGRLVRLGSACSAPPQTVCPPHLTPGGAAGRCGSAPSPALLHQLALNPGSELERAYQPRMNKPVFPSVIGHNDSTYPIYQVILRIPWGHVSKALGTIWKHGIDVNSDESHGRCLHLLMGAGIIGSPGPWGQRQATA